LNLKPIDNLWIEVAAERTKGPVEMKGIKQGLPEELTDVARIGTSREKKDKGK